MLESGAGDPCQCSLGAKTFRKEGKLVSLTLRGNCVICCCEPGRVCCLPISLCNKNLCAWLRPLLSVDSVKVSVIASGIELPWKRLCFLGFPEGCCGIEPLPGKLGFSCAGGCAPALPMWATLGVGQLAARQLAWAD